jgi:hypothetical protein
VREDEELPREDEMDLNAIVGQMDDVVSKGRIVEAVEQYFDANAATRDFDGTLTRGKAQMLDKMRSFAAAIEKVNEIRLHRRLVDGDVSMSEYTFDFDMKDGSHVLWHEIIRREWRDGLVVNEQYFRN